MNEKEVISNIGALLTIILSRVYSNVNRQLSHYHRHIRKRILDVSRIGLTLGNNIYSHEAIELLNIWSILGNYETISKFNKNETKFEHRAIIK